MNIYRETFKEEGLKVEKYYLPKINGYKIEGAYIKENGTDEIDGKNKPYVVMKIYMDEVK